METVTTIARLIVDALTLGWLLLRRDQALAAENLFLRKQLAFYQERGTRPRRLDAPTRAVLVVLVWSKNSCGIAVIVFEQPAQAFPARDGSFGVTGVRGHNRKQQDVVFALMISFAVIMRQVFV